MTYHDACHLAHGQGVRSQPRELMELCAKHEGVQFVALGESEMCCGSAGSYNITQPQMAMQLLERKMKHIAKTGAQVVVTGNPGCAMQIMLGAKKFGPSVEVLHPVQVLDRATDNTPPKE
jgi:glycolate oxidase iron-sulfur subunit